MLRTHINALALSCRQVSKQIGGTLFHARLGQVVRKFLLVGLGVGIRRRADGPALPRIYLHLGPSAIGAIPGLHTSVGNILAKGGRVGG